MEDSIDIDSLMDDVQKPSYGEDAAPKKEATNYNGNNGGNGNYNKGNYNGNYKKKEKTTNMFEVEFVEPKDIDTDTFEKNGRSFMVVEHNIPEEVAEKIVKVATKLLQDGFTFRFDGTQKESALQNKILSMCGDKNVECYIPYKKFNENIENGITPNAYELPYRYASKLYGKAFNEKLGKGSKAMHATKIHALLGINSDNPIDFLICYNVNGDEVYPPYKKGGPAIDYTKLGNLGFYLKATDKTNINVYNFKKIDSIKNLIELIK